MRSLARLALAASCVACTTDRQSAAVDTSPATPATHAQHSALDDSAFAELQRRGGVAMGVDQYTSQHRFIPLSDGGRIVLQRDSVDAAGTATIRAHMREIAAAFADGRFDIPGFVHAGEVPGTRVMAARRGSIRYAAADLPGGAEVRITTSDPELVAAVHEFLAFQRQEHRAPAR